MAGIGVLSVTLQTEVKWSAQNNLVGGDYQPLINGGDIRKSGVYSTNNANATLGGADEIISYLLTIAGGASATIDLTALTNILQQTGITLARIKGFQFRLLSVADDAVYGTVATEVDIGNAASNSQQLGVSGTATKALFNGGVWAEFDGRAGGYVLGANTNLKIANADGAHSAVVQVTLTGATT